MKRYEKYKPSGIDWAETIPNSWRCCEIARFTKSKSGGTPDRGKQSYWENGTIPWMSSGEVNKVNVYDTEEYITELGMQMSSAKLLDINTVVIALNGQGKTKAMSAILRIKSTCNQSLCGFKCDERNLHYAYLFYCFQTMYKYLRSQAGDDSRDGISAYSVTKQKIPVPSFDEQIAIAAYIDAKCAKIDNVVEVQHKRIELLKELKQSIITHAVTKGLNKNAKMKNSGVDRIVDVPEGWEVKRIKRITYLIRGGSPRPIEQYTTTSEDGYNWIKIGDTDKGCKYITHAEEKIKKEGLPSTRYVKVGDLILSNSMSFGQPYILKINGCIHDGWLALTRLKNVDKEYLYYMLQSTFCKQQFEMSVDGGVVKNLNIDKVGMSYIFLPPLPEQTAIVAYLDKKCAAIDRQIAKVEKQIELLGEYKQSVITECVTGKRKVC